MISALFISLREGLEAALIIGIVLSYLGRIGRRESVVFAWAGIIAAAVLSALVGLGMRFIGAELETPYEQIFEGTTMLFAVVILTWMIFWMRYQSRFMKRDLERQVQSVVTAGQNWGIFALTFLAVFREGIETALFLAANAFAADGFATLAGALAGLALAALAGALIYVYAVRFNLSLFFDITSVFLIIFSAGLLVNGIGEFQEIGALPILTAPVWDSRWLLDSESNIGALLRSLVGYNDQPSMLQLTIYFVYWVVIVQGIRWWTQRLSSQLIQKHA